jgi:predicted ribosomally synthesized peptide with SipW-like signal peptide
MLKRIALSISLMAFAGVLVYGATGAFFSDSETSTGNTFTAGDIDLKIDNESYVTNNAGTLVASPANSWEISDLTNQLFFSFGDVKPGDVGEDTISVHAGTNDAFACMAAAITSTPENTLVDPEVDAGDAGPAAGNNGELQNYLNFTFWNDDGDNVYEVGETQITQLTGPASTIFNGAWAPIVGSTTTAIPGNTTQYVAKAWCFGTLALGSITQDGLGKLPGSTNGPLVRGTGVTCNGSGSNNIAQTDGVVVDVSFQAVQARNNGQFTCSSLPTFTGTSTVPVVVVGAANFAVGAPTCDITANDDGAVSAGFTAGANAIGDAITAATPGQTICVAPGTYNQFVVNKSVIIRGLSDPEGGTPATVVPSSASVTDLALVSADNVTITGLKFDGLNTVIAGQAAGIRISPVAANLTGANITYNVVTNVAAATGFSAKGIQWFTDTDSGFSLSNSNIKNNTISNIDADNKGAYGIQTVGAMSNVAIQNNTITNSTGAWGGGIAVDTKNTTLTAVTGSTISLNQIMSGVSDGLTRFAVQIENRIDATGVGVHQNNIETSLHGGGNAPFGTEGILDAENNWYGVAVPTATDVYNTGANTTDVTPAAAAAFAVNP